MFTPSRARQYLRAKVTGYGMALLMVFLGTTVLIGASMQIMAGPTSLAYLGAASQDNLAAQQLAQAGMNVVVADLQSKYDAGTSITTAYSYSSASSPTSTAMPSDPTALTTRDATVGSYTGSIVSTNGNSMLVKVTATVGSGSYAFTKLITLTHGSYSLDNSLGATAAYGLRKLRSAYAGSAVRVRRGSDNVEQDIGFDAAGNLDINALRTFLDNSASYPKPLDSVGSAVAAYSLRQLSSTYYGAAIRVRRSSDNAEQDIYFDAAGNLDLNSLINFVGTGSGYVKTWYDQSGNAANATQATAASQPRIVNAGVMDMFNGKPTVVFDGTADNLRTSTYVTNFILGDLTATLVINNNSGGVLLHKGDGDTVWESGEKKLWMGGGVGNWDEMTKGAYPNFVGWGNDYAKSSSSLSANQGIVTYSWDYTAAANDGVPIHYVNGYSGGLWYDGMVTTPDDTNTNILQIGAGPAGSYYQGNMSEIIIYGQVLTTANRQTLENDQARYYQLTMAQPSYTKPLDLVGSAAVAYGLRQLRAAYAGNVIQVRRSSDNTTQDIGFDTVGNLNVATLMNFCGANSCYVTTWYDQSGNANNAVQATTSKQPRIVNAGVLDTQQGRPSLYFNGGGQNELTYTLLTPLDVLMVSGFSSSINNPQIGYGSGSWQRFVLTSTQNAYRGNTGLTFTNAAALSGLAQISFDATTAFAVSSWTNGSISSPASQTDSSMVAVKNFGNYNNAGFYTGYLSEVIMYTGSNISSANRQLLEGNQMGYYNVNSNMPATGFVTKWYDQSGNGYDLSQPTTLLQPRIQWDNTTNRPTIAFNGRSTYLTSPNTLSLTSAQMTGFAVANLLNNTSTSARIFSGRNNSTSDHDSASAAVFMFYNNSLNKMGSFRNSASLGNSTFNFNQMFQATMMFDGTNNTFRMNGVAGTSAASSGAFNINQIWMGVAPHMAASDYWIGTISEAILYPSNPTATQIQMTEQDQRSYYGTP